MMKKLFRIVAGIGLGVVFGGAAGLAPVPSRAAEIIQGPWTPIFQGIELASGQQISTTNTEPNLRLLCYRVDLTDPDVRLFTTPKCTNCGGFDTLAQNTSHFLDQYDLQVAINGGFYSSSFGPNDVPLNTPEDVKGLAISEGNVVSPADDTTRAATLLFTTNNLPIIVPNNNPPTNTAGIFTAISGDRVLLTNGVIGPTSNPSDRDPRSAVGYSADGRYLFMMTLDGRQPGWSDGADWFTTAQWIQRFGAFNAINIDGGGSTTMVMQDCSGAPLRLNRSSFVFTYGRERIIGHNFGIRAKALAGARKATVSAGSTTANITWTTDFPASTQVEYGPTTAYGSTTPLQSRLTRLHVATLSGLVSGSNYFFRVVSRGVDGQTFTEECQFTTRRLGSSSLLFDVTKSWRYTTNNLDGQGWKSPDYDDSSWSGPGQGLLYVLEPAVGVSPKNTAMPPLQTVASIPRTYYFRTSFNYSGPTAGTSLTFSNFVDDGAVFYLNGTEIYRLRMPAAPTAILNSTTPTAVPCVGIPGVQQGDALTLCPDVFTVAGSLISANLLQGENVISVEVHNLTGTDLVFGSALFANQASQERPTLNLWIEDNIATLYWNGEGFRLQRSSDISAPANWSDAPGPSAISPYNEPGSAPAFYRLRN